MTIHFDTQSLAVEHLRKSDFRLLENGRWVSPSREVVASIHPRFGEVVCVMFLEAA